MRINKGALLIIGLVFIALAFATSGNISTFTNGLSSENLTNITTTRYMNVPLASITNVILNMSSPLNESNYDYWINSKIAYYPFEQSINNEIDTSNTLSLGFGSESYLIGKVGAYAFNFSGNQLRNTSFSHSGINTIDFWIYLDQTGTNGRIIDLETTGGTNTEIRNYPNGSLYVQYRTDVYPAGTPNQIVLSNNFNISNNWYHIMLTYTGGNISLYVNNTLYDTQNTSHNIATSSFIKLLLGREDGGGGIFWGKLDNLFFYGDGYSSNMSLASYNNFDGINFSNPVFNISTSNPYLEIGDIDGSYEWNFSGIFSDSETVEVTNFLNNILNNNCNCADCTLTLDYCQIPFIFGKDNLGILQYDILNSSYSYTLNITIRDADSNALITNNISARFISDTDEQTYYTTTGTLSREDITTGEYEIFFSDTGTDYSSRTYTITMANGNQNLNAYLEKNTSTVTFTVADRSSSELLEGVLGTMYRYINGSYAVIESKTTDVTGRIVFSYQSNINYRFLFTKSNYDNYLFTLNPVLFNEYDIKMDPVARINYSMDYDRVSIAYGPTLFYEGANNFTYIISSPYGELDTYSFSLTYPGGSTGNSGSNALGETFTPTFIITGATSSDTVRFDYNYTLDLNTVRTFTYYFPIAINGSNQTMVGIRDNTYGLGIGERLIIAVLGAIFIVGIAFLIGRPVPGLALGLFWFGILVYIGFIPWWSVAITILAGVIFIGLRGEV